MRNNFYFIHFFLKKLKFRKYIFLNLRKAFDNKIFYKKLNNFYKE